MDIKNLQDDPICECGGYITGIYIAEHDQNDDIAIQTVVGRCDKCGKEKYYREYFKYVGCEVV